MASTSIGNGIGAASNTNSSYGQFKLRPLRLSDAQPLALLSAQAYQGSPINRYIAPKAELYWDDFVRNFRRSIQRRYFEPRSLSLVACLSSDESMVVGYGQFSRLGNDGAALSYARARKSFLMLILSWIFWIYDKVTFLAWPDRASDKNAMKIFHASVVADNQTYWTSHPERSCRWHAQSIVVSPQWQGRGVGRMLLSEVLSRAEKEGVIAGLSASPAGEKLYHRLGFQLLGDFTFRLGGDDGGGIMIWYPEGGIGSHGSGQKIF